MYEWSFDEFLIHSNRIRLQHDMVKLDEEESRKEQALADSRANAGFRR